MKYFNKIILVIRIRSLKKIWISFNDVCLKLKRAISEDKKFRKLFIIDSDDEILNKKVLDKYKKEIQKYKLQSNRLKIKFYKYLSKLNLLEDDSMYNFILLCEKYKINPSKVSFIKDVIKFYLKLNSVKNEEERSKGES